VSDTEADNRVERVVGGTPSPELPAGSAPLHHHELLWMIGGYEPDRGVAAAGHRAYFLTGAGTQLNIALISYALQFLRERDYSGVQPPYFLNKEVMGAVAELDDYDEQLYHVSGEKGDSEKYLIATSEQPLCTFHRGDWLMPKELPLKYAGWSTCFRKEAGSHGRDTWGIFRVHQFEKIEQFVVCSPDDSWRIHEEMIATAEQFYDSLGLSYRVITLVSKEVSPPAARSSPLRHAQPAAPPPLFPLLATTPAPLPSQLNNAAAKKYDLEAWFPGYAEYRELVSCSNCTDFQARAMGVRFGQKTKGSDGVKTYAHMLNSTLCATTRTICAILENYQTPDGVKVPEVLVPFMGGTTFLPFVRDKPKNTQAAKVAKGKAAKTADSPKAAKGGAAAASASSAAVPAKAAAPAPKAAAKAAAAPAAAAAAAGVPASIAARPSLATPEGLASLNARLVSAPYVGGFRPSPEDAAVFAALAAAPAAAVYPHAARWYRHVAAGGVALPAAGVLALFCE